MTPGATFLHVGAGGSGRGREARVFEKGIASSLLVYFKKCKAK